MPLPGHDAVPAPALAHSPEGRRVFTTLSVLDNIRLGAFVRHSNARPKGDGRVLSATQEDAMQRTIVDKRPYQQNPETVQAWLQGEYPGIEQRAKREGAEIHSGDVTALTNTNVRGRSDAPAGKTPVVLSVGGTRQKLSMIATVTNQGKSRWRIIEESFDADKFCESLQALIKDAG